ncbi:MAG: hypothetical protein AAF664_12270 [Planctomycetota bacterium]
MSAKRTKVPGKREHLLGSYRAMPELPHCPDTANLPSAYAAAPHPAHGSLFDLWRVPLFRRMIYDG